MALYKEIVRRHQNVIIIRFTAMIVSIIVISDFMEFIAVRGNIYRYFKYFINISMILFFLYELRRTNIKYKYSVFQDQLTVYRLLGKEERLLRDVNISDIIKIKKCKSYKDKLLWFIGTRYDFYKINNHYTCIYNDNGSIKKFYFNPSDNLIRILKNSKCDVE